MQVTCWGAARTVTGSMHLAQAAGQTILLDCGLFQGGWSESFARNRHLPFDVRELDAVILTHAHLDHCGNLPGLVNVGYAGPIYCTAATRDLTAAMVRDAAHIQEQDAEHINYHRQRRGEKPDAVPLYTRADAERAIRQLHGLSYYRWMMLGKYARFMFLDAGHILGSAITVFEVEEGNTTRRFCYSGDLGRAQPRLLRAKDFVAEMDALLVESTYGNRRHDSSAQIETELAQVVRETVARGGRVVIPAFAVDRTQEIVFILRDLRERGAIPDLAIFVDSPLASDVTDVYRVHLDCFNADAGERLLHRADPFGMQQLRYVRARAESVQINYVTEPCIIIAGAGMCEGGRIRHHLVRVVEDARNTILIVSYQAVNTLGRRLADREERVKILGNEYVRRARVKILNGFSGHADSGELVEWLKEGAGKLKNVCIVHGEESQSLAFAEKVRALGIANVSVPQRGETVML